VPNFVEISQTVAEISRFFDFPRWWLSADRHLGFSRFTANLRIVMSLSLSNVLIGVCVLLSNIPLVPVVDSNAETCAFTHCKRH